MRNWPVAALVAILLGGCSSLPAGGPSGDDIVAARQSESLPDGMELFDIDAAKAAILASFRSQPLAGRFADQRPKPTQSIGIGDQIGVTIFEASAGGLFSTSNGQIGGGSKNVALPNQEVGPTGTINVPYVGRIKVVGMTTEQVEKTVVDHLRDKAIEPQAVVTMQAARSSLIAVNGEVGHPGRYPLSPRGDRMMDSLASAGGIKGNPDDIFVRLTRKSTTGAVPLRAILDEPSQNIWIWPGDQIYVYREPQIFTAVGATSRSGNFPLVFERTTLAEAIGDAAGLNSVRAEPSGTFIFRRERAEVVCALKAERPCAAPDTPRPVVYRLDLRNPAGFALAQRIPMRNKDVVYVADANTIELLKFLSLVSAFSNLGNTASQAGARIHHWN